LDTQDLGSTTLVVPLSGVADPKEDTMPRTTTERLTTDQKKLKKALQESYDYARGVEENPEMQAILKRERTPGQSLTREEFRRKYLG